MRPLSRSVRVRGLTRALLASGARHVIAVERDERALPALEEISRRYPGRLEIVCADAQDFDPRPWLGSAHAKIVANLPYNIATALLVEWLSIEPWPPWYDTMVLMFQREVAERIVARENDEAYGRLGVLANWRAETKILFDISPAAFVPQPKVTSSVVRLLPRAAPEACDRRALEQVARRHSVSDGKCCAKASNHWPSIRPGWSPRPRLT